MSVTSRATAPMRSPVSPRRCPRVACRIEPYLIKAARCARRWPGVSGGLSLGRPARRTPGHAARLTRFAQLIRHANRTACSWPPATVASLIWSPYQPRWPTRLLAGSRATRLARRRPRRAGRTHAACQPNLGFHPGRRPAVSPRCERQLQAGTACGHAALDKIMMGNS